MYYIHKPKAFKIGAWIHTYIHTYTCSINTAEKVYIHIKPVVLPCIVGMDSVRHIHRHDEAVPERSHQRAWPNMSEYNIKTIIFDSTTTFTYTWHYYILYTQNSDIHITYSTYTQ